MEFRHAAKLHNRDEVTLKETGEVGYVLNAWVAPADPKVIVVEAVFPHAGYQQVTHRDIA